MIFLLWPQLSSSRSMARTMFALIWFPTRTQARQLTTAIAIHGRFRLDGHFAVLSGYEREAV